MLGVGSIGYLNRSAADYELHCHRCGVNSPVKEDALPAALSLKDCAASLSCPHCNTRGDGDSNCLEIRLIAGV